MRIIAGNARGRRLAAPKGMQVRPTPDRVREALFSILMANIEGAEVLDLFAGSGALGLEALSRGARHVTFAEKSRRVIEILEQNCQLFDEEQYRILSMPAQRAVEVLGDEEARFDLILLDPPYDARLLEPALHSLEERKLLKPTTIVVCEHRGNAVPPQPPTAWVLESTRKYGDVAVSLYLRETEETP